MSPARRGFLYYWAIKEGHTISEVATQIPFRPRDEWKWKCNLPAKENIPWSTIWHNKQPPCGPLSQNAMKYHRRVLFKLVFLYLEQYSKVVRNMKKESNRHESKFWLTFPNSVIKGRLLTSVKLKSGHVNNFMKLIFFKKICFCIFIILP